MHKPEVSTSHSPTANFNGHHNHCCRDYISYTSTGLSTITATTTTTRQDEIISAHTHRLRHCIATHGAETFLTASKSGVAEGRAASAQCPPDHLPTHLARTWKILQTPSQPLPPIQLPMTRRHAWNCPLSSSQTKIVSANLATSCLWSTMASTQSRSCESLRACSR